jgi:hypothetical protein
MTMKRMHAVLVAPLIFGGVALTSVHATAATVCIPTTFVQDSHPLTAAVVNTSVAPGTNLDASSCDIGIFYNNSGTATLDNVSVFGAKYYGVLSDGAAVITNIVDNSSVYDIGDQPLSGAQHGIDVAFRDGAGGTLRDSLVYDYQKGGVLATGSGTNVSVLSNVVEGVGPTPLIAQNGVQFSQGAVGTINNNFIEDNEYTGCTKQQAHSGTCTFVVSTGILLFQVDPSLVNTKNNTYRNNDVNLLNAA